MSGRVASERFIGRDAELELLEEGSAAVVIVGEAGVGKSRLVSELERRAEDTGKLVLIGECLELTDGELPYAPIVAALRPVLGDPAALDGIGATEKAELARLWPELDLGEGESSSGSSQSRLFALLLRLLTRLADGRQVVFVIEDLHWADRSTRDFVSFLVRAARGTPVSLIATIRAEELHAQHPLRAFVAELVRVRGVRRVELEPFSRAELALQVREILGEPPSPTLVERLFERSEGNAFYTEELLAAGAGAELPASLRDALMVRIERLSEPARRLLAAVATAERAIDARLLAAIAEVSGAEFDPALRETLTNQVLVATATGAYMFRHALLREAVYRDLLETERQRLHRATACALLDHPELRATGIGAASELAHHWYAAGELVSAFEASLRAGAEAERAFAFTEAHRQYERALELWDHVPDAAIRAGFDRAALLERAAGAAVHADHPARTVVLARAAIEQVDERDAGRLARLYVLAGRGLWLSAEHSGSLAAYREAVRLVPTDPPTSERALVVAAEAQALMLSGKSRDAYTRGQEALELARAVGDRYVEAHVHNTLAGLGWASLDPVAHAATARAIAFELGAVEEIGRSYANGSEALDQAGRIEDAIALAQEGIDAAPSWGLHDFTMYLTSHLADWQLRAGRLDAAEALLADTSPRGHTAAAPRLRTLGQLATMRGNLDEAAATLERAEEMSRGLGGPEWWPVALAALGTLRLWQGRLDEAAAALRKAIAAVDDPQFASWLHDFAEVFATSARIEADRAESARARREPVAAAVAQAADAADRLGAMLALLDDDSQVPRARAFHALARAEVGRAAGRSEPSAWERAAEQFRALGEPYSVAYAEYRQAESLLQTRGDGTSPLRAAHAITTRLGEQPLRAEIEALARRFRVPLGDADGSDPATELGITAREREVLKLLADGRTNREIAELLVITEKTASVHVSHILGKLGASNRSEAGAIARRLGLTDL